MATTRTPQQQQGIGKARKAGLHYVDDLDDGWTRRRCGRGFMYFSSRNRRLVGKRTLQRIANLAIPPAWEDVRICPAPDGHLQATGMDDKGRKQYRYHDDWNSVSAATKFDRLELIGGLLPKVRRRIRRDLGMRGLGKERVIAAIVRLIDKAHLRVGSPVYAEENGSYGATTLLPDQVEIEKVSISLNYPGKSGKQMELRLSDAKVAAVIRKCEEIDGQFLFCYLDDDKEYRPVHSTDVNNYLRTVAGAELSAKDFRTWSATVLALKHLGPALQHPQQEAARRSILQAVENTAEEMGHTKSVCRQHYIHPALLYAFESGKLARLVRKFDSSDAAVPAELTRAEALLLSILPSLSS